jgi:osmotically-inducible protein OsmY
MTPPALPHANRETSTSAHLPANAREAEERLGKSSYRALRDVSCLASGGVLYLHGCLSSHYLKQVAQEVVSGAAGVHHVVNRIVVSRPGRSRLDRETFANPSI